MSAVFSGYVVSTFNVLLNGTDEFFEGFLGFIIQGNYKENQDQVT